MSVQPLRVGVIGLGVGASHAEAYVRLRETQLVALCDMNEARLTELSKQCQVEPEGRFTDFREMLEKTRLDLVSICLPNALHAETTVAALEAGVHVLCEKPLAPSTFEVQDMIRAARLNNRRLMVAYNHRYRADVFWIKRLIEEGRLGKIHHVEAWWRRETGIPGRGWFGQRQHAGGGSLIDLGVHVLDMALWLLGFPAVETVTGEVRSLFGPRGLKVWGVPRWMTQNEPEAVFDVEDGAVGFLRLGNGASMILHATWAEHRPPNDDLIRLEIQGTEGSAVLNIPNYTRQDTVRFYTLMAGAPVTVTPIVKWEGPMGHEGLIADVVKSLRDNTPPPTTAEQGLTAVRVLEALYHSAASGREVVFETEPDALS